MTMGKETDGTAAAAKKQELAIRSYRMLLREVHFIPSSSCFLALGLRFLQLQTRRTGFFGSGWLYVLLPFQPQQPPEMQHKPWRGHVDRSLHLVCFGV